jgi:hypothetical protein
MSIKARKENILRNKDYFLKVDVNYELRNNHTGDSSIQDTSTINQLNFHKKSKDKTLTEVVSKENKKQELQRVIL